MGLGNEFARQLKALVDATGNTMTFRRPGVSAYDPDTSTTTSSAADDDAVKVALIEYHTTEVDGTKIQRGDRQALITIYDTSGATLAKQPQVGDQFVGVGKTVTVIDVEPIMLNDVLVGHICQVRQ